MLVSIVKSGRNALFALMILSITSSISQERASEILRIINRTQIYCVSEERVHWPMFTSPPLQKVQFDENSLVDGKWENDDWTTRDSSHMISTNIVDKRWEDFQIKKINYWRFINLNSSLSFSVHRADYVEFFADDGESLDFFEQRVGNKNEWTTFFIFFKDGHIHYYMENKYIRNYSLRPTQVVVKTREMAYFKIHKYKFKEAITVANANQNPSSLIVPRSDKSLLMIFVSLCSACILEVKYGDENVYITSNNKETDILEQWQAYTIQLNTNVTNKMQFIRTRNNHTQEGYWKLDVRLYDNENNKVIYEINSNEEMDKKYRCKYLQPPTNSNHKRAKRQENLRKYADITKCPVGMIGANCDVSCKNILGRQYLMCDEHKICNSMFCECAWGYSGEWCDTKCTDGHWGLGCKKECTDCTVCDRYTGKCSIAKGSIKSYVFCGMGVLLVAIPLSVIILIKRKHISSKTASPNSSSLNANGNDDESYQPIFRTI